MNWSGEIDLLEYETLLDQLNSPYLNLKASKPVFCNVLSVKRTEFYQAQAVGYKPEKVFEIKIEDFEEKYNYVRYQGKDYSILRTYQADLRTIELTCVGKTNERI